MAGPTPSSGAIDPNAITAANGASLQAWANSIAVKYQIPVDLFSNLIAHESGWNAAARGQAGEIGLGQIMPSTGQSFMPDINLNDPVQNLFGAARYLSAQYKIAGDWTGALQLYNSGSKTGAPTYAAQVLAGQDSSGKALPYGQPVDAKTGVPASIAGAVNQFIADHGAVVQQVNPATGAVDLMGKNLISGDLTSLAGTGGDELWLGPAAFDPASGQIISPSADGNYNFPQAVASSSLTPEQKAALAGAPSDPTASAGALGVPGLTLQNVAIYGGIALVIVVAVVMGFAVIGRQELTQHGS